MSKFSNEQREASSTIRALLVLVDANALETKLDAGPNAKLKLGLVVEMEDGTAKLCGRWEYEPFIKAVESLLCPIADDEED